MKKLVKLILLCLIAYPIISIVSSCSEEEDCSMNARPMMECYLYTVDRESKRVLNDTLDSLTITAFDTDSVILNNQKRVHSLSLPLRYTADSTVLIFHYIAKIPRLKRHYYYLSKEYALFPVNGLWLSDETKASQAERTVAIYLTPYIFKKKK